MSIHKLIREGRKRLGLSEEEFARRVGVSRGAVQQWERPDGTAPRRANQRAVAELLGITVGELMSGGSNLTAGPEVKGDVPVISWVQAGEFADVTDPFQPGDAEEWLPCVKSHGKHTFALRVRGDSMTSPHGKSYPHGCVIFVDPDRRNPVNGDRIVAKLEDQEEATFKVFKNEDGRMWLQPLNPQHEPIRRPFKVVGTVIGKWEDE
jgi:SOS-response transcriptional repressor LexA